MNALRVVAGTRPERRRYLALGWVLGVGAFALGLSLAEPFVAATGPWLPVAAVALLLLAAVAAYDGAGLPATAGLVALAAAGMVPFVATVAIARMVPPTSALAVQVTFSAAVALLAGVTVGLVGFAVGAAARWVRERRANGSRDPTPPAAPASADAADDGSRPRGGSD
ncbi:hypothetical protein [Candidatus Halobonum tyrrellensis]|uniref:Uncharacterized protein n=1 Tax=Candidatus Halobonum tyrrellensis G22 TaxID=1324957 RepID=V4J0J6_9EURY|nr:hypothetical protein [Candidatus Halobonum tyrrellensis]ESP88987.1 hypothetical protein K933_06043 [Candidatus Halobonum tyrrellensis G22]